VRRSESELRRGAAYLRLLTCLVAATALWQAVPSLDDTIDRFRESRDAPRSAREAAQADALDLPAGVIPGARRAIPPHGRYAIVVGDSIPMSAAQRDGLKPMLAGALLPRRQVGVEESGWVIAYGAPTELVGVPVGRQTEVAPGVVVAEIER
jgi:hypothetical protein